MSSDATVGIIPPGTPSTYVDNSAVTNDAGQAVMRQRVEDPILISLIDSVRQLVGSLSLASDPASGRLRVFVDPNGGAQTLGTVTTVGTVSNVTSIATLANQTYQGGLNTNPFMPAQMQIPVNMLRQQINVTGV